MQPSKNLNTIFWLSFKVVPYIINNDCFSQVSAQHTKVFYVNAVLVLTVLPIEAMVDEFIVFLYVVQNEVCIVLSCSCENHHFVYL